MNSNHKIFMESHGMFQEDAVNNFTDLIESESVHSYDKIGMKQVAEYLDVSPDYLWKNNNNSFFPYFYQKDNVYIDLHGGIHQIETLVTLKTKEMIKAVHQRMDECLSEGDYELMFNMMEKKILLRRYVELFDEIPDENKFDIFISIYKRSEYGFNIIPKRVIEKVIEYKSLSSSSFERMKKVKELANDDGMIKVFRGNARLSTDAEQAYSWTLDEDVAEWFAKRFEGSGEVYEAEIHKTDVIDYLESRRENEIILNPEKLVNVIGWDV